MSTRSSIPIADPNLLDQPAREQIRLETVLHAFADPVRMGIVRDLAVGRSDMSCISFHLPVSKSTATHHFRVLREAGVISQHKRGTARVSRLRYEDLDALFPGLLDSVIHGDRAQRARDLA
ncbi:ArsR/SmtB family transcription factor [Embleya sp. AB8]|uniref:ArsR/SmtB family transcription factor n=1 Tax=Embleya sp. AB8 TaxID=3156304 RepID=UPI003C786A99